MGRLRRCPLPVPRYDRVLEIHAGAPDGRHDAVQPRCPMRRSAGQRWARWRRRPRQRAALLTSLCEPFHASPTARLQCEATSFNNVKEQALENQLKMHAIATNPNL